MSTDEDTSRYVTVFHQIKDTDLGDEGDRLVSLGETRDDRYKRDDEAQGFVPYARPIAIIDAGVEMDGDGLNEWCNSHAGKAVLSRYFQDLEPEDPTLPDVEEYVNGGGEQ